MRKFVQDFMIILFFSAFVFYCAGKTSKEIAVKKNPPNPPSNIKVSLSLKAPVPQVSIYWADNSSDEEGFRIYARSSDQTSYKLIATVPPDSTSYLDANSPFTKSYYYSVNAFNGNGESSTGMEGLRLGYMATINKANIVDYEIFGTTLMILSNDGVSSIDLSDPKEPVFIKTVPLKGSVKKGFLKISHPYVYAVDGSQFYALNSEDPADLSIKSSIELPFNPIDMEYFKQTLIFLGEDSSLYIMDAGNPKPKIVRSMKTEGRFQNISISNNFLFASNCRDGIWIYDISNPKNPVLHKKYAPQPQRYFSSVSAWDGKIIASVRDFENALQVISFGTGEPDLAGTIPVNWTPLENSISKNVILVPESEAGVELILAINPSAMRIIGNIESEVDKIKATDGLILASYHDNFYIFSTP